VKRPSFQFYPGDWLHDHALRACSLAARGLWADMLCFMHQGTPYGHLTLPGVVDTLDVLLRPILPPILARMVGSSAEAVEALLGELASVGVYSVTEGGVIYSRRMVADEQRRETLAACGIQSLKNPNVPRPKATEKDTERVSLAPSSSSSSTSSTPSSSEPKGSDQDRRISIGKTPEPTVAGVRLTGLLKKGILTNNPGARITANQEIQWACEADRMMRIDQREESQIADLIVWSQQDHFWRTNILSMGKLREKFDQLTIKWQQDSERCAGQRNHGVPGQPPSSASYEPASQKMRATLAAEREAAKTVSGRSA
jgi:hypothetical protein